MTAPTRTSGVDTSITRSEVIDMRRAHDVIIIGGGAAGLSAALVLGRARRRVVVIDAGTPRNAPAAHMQGYLSRDGLPPADLVAFGRAEVAGYGVELVDDTVTDRVVLTVASVKLTRVCVLVIVLVTVRVA